MSRFRRRAWSHPVSLVFSLAAVAGVSRPLAAEERVVAPTSEVRETSLEELLEYAEAHAPVLGVVEQRKGYAVAERAAASPPFRANPTLEFGVGPRFDAASEVDFDFFVAVAQPVGISGERGRRRDAAARLGERLDADATLARLMVRREVTLAYYAALLGRRNADLGTRAVAFAEDMLRIAERRLTAGDATAIDVRVAETDVAAARQALLTAEAERDTARIRLAEVTGWDLESPPRVSAELPELVAVPPLSRVLDSAAAHHPELAARRARVAEAEARVEVAKREGWPTPVLGAQVAREGSAGSPANYIVLGTVGVTLPVWQRNQGERATRQVDREVARAEETASERALVAGIARAHARLTAATDRVRLLSSSVTPQLESSLALLRRGVDAGEFSLLDVAVARERFLAAERDTLDAHADYCAALADLEFALGARLPPTAETSRADSGASAP